MWPVGAFTVTSVYFNVNFEVECQVNGYVRIIVELVSVCINILQVICLFNNLCYDCLKILKEKTLGKQKKKSALQRTLWTLAKNGKKCRNISAN